MKLSEATRQVLPTGDILLFRGTRPHSYLIRWITGYPYSHAAIVYWMPWWQATGYRLYTGRMHYALAYRPYCIEALEGHGVRLEPLDRYLEDCRRQKIQVDWFGLQGGGIDRDRLAGYCLDQVGQRYVSLWQFIRSFTHLGKLARQFAALKIVQRHNPNLCLYDAILERAQYATSAYKPHATKRGAPSTALVIRGTEVVDREACKKALLDPWPSYTMVIEKFAEIAPQVHFQGKIIQLELFKHDIAWLHMHMKDLIDKCASRRVRKSQS